MNPEGAESSFMQLAHVALQRRAVIVPYARGLPEWLISSRAATGEIGNLDLWQRSVDKLVVAASGRPAGYAD